MESLSELVTGASAAGFILSHLFALLTIDACGSIVGGGGGRAVDDVTATYNRLVEA